MSRQRRIRDETDGASVYYNIDKSNKPTVGAGHPPPTPSGAGIFDTARALAANVATKLTGKAAKRIATKAFEKGAEKVGEKTGEKLGVLLGEKIFNSKSLTEQGDRKNRGDQINKELQRDQINQRMMKKPPGEKSISQQFEDLLNLF